MKESQVVLSLRSDGSSLRTVGHNVADPVVSPTSTDISKGQIRHKATTRRVVHVHGS